MDSAGWDTRRASDLLLGGEPNRFVAEESTGSPPGGALDIGAGEGRNATWLAGLGWRVTAVDFSPAAVAQEQPHRRSWPAGLTARRAERVRRRSAGRSAGTRTVSRTRTTRAGLSSAMSKLTDTPSPSRLNPCRVR